MDVPRSPMRKATRSTPGRPRKPTRRGRGKCRDPFTAQLRADSVMQHTAQIVICRTFGQQKVFNFFFNLFNLEVVLT